MKSDLSKHLEDNISRKKIIIFVNRENFIQYIRREKKYFINLLDSKYNQTNIFSGKKIKLSLSDNKVNISGTVGEVYIFDNFVQLLNNSKLLKLFGENLLAKDEILVSKQGNYLKHKVIVFRIILKLPYYRNKFVITGGPGFGKTTLLKKLEKLGYTVFHEAARAIIEEQKNSDNPILPWKDRVKFDNKITKKMMFDYQQHQSRYYSFYDRGFPDLIGWREYDQLDISNIKKLAYICPYERLVFLTEPWKEIYEINRTRPYSFDEACRINDLLEKCYSNLGYIIEYIPKVDVEQRANFILDTVSRYKK